MLKLKLINAWIDPANTIDRDLIKTQSFGVYHARTTQNVSMEARIHVPTFITDLLERNDIQTDISIYYG